MAKTLSVDRVVNATINLQPLAAGRRNFGVMLLVGASAVIDVRERLRAYTGIAGVAADFGVSAPEYAAAELFFSQSPRPSQLRIGRWAKTATPAILQGAQLTEDAAYTEWTGITDGEFTVTINGTDNTITGLSFASVTNMNGVASVINTALTANGAGCVWDGNRFVISTTSTGTNCSLSNLGAVSAGSGTDISAKMKMTTGTGLAPIAGMAAETVKEAVAALADASGDWYGCAFADDSLSAADHLAVSAYIEASAKSRIYGVTITDTRVMDATYTDDIAARAKALGYKRTMVCYSANPYAVVSAMGRAFTVNFSANRSTITLKFKQLPGIAAEGLTETQAGALADKRCNVYAAYDNDTAIYQEGVMSGQAYFDEIHGLDWLQNAVQTETWNLLYQSKTKIPQTDSGANQIVNAIEGVFAEAVNNGLIAPGTWNGDPIGTLETGDYLETGFYVTTTRMADQAQSEREQRKCPPIQCAVKLAGAIHSVDVQIDVNR